MGTLKRTVAYEYNHTVNGEDTDRVTKITDSGDEGLPFTDKDYEFVYDDDLRLTKVIHPQDYYEEFYYDTYGRMTARRDVDGGITSVGRDTLQRLHQLTDPWGHVTTFNYNGSSDPDPLGTLKEILYSNGAKVEYGYDSLNRLSWLSNKATGGGNAVSPQKHPPSPGGFGLRHKGFRLRPKGYAGQVAGQDGGTSYDTTERRHDGRGKWATDEH